jgi:hypothetical protein
MHDIFFLQYFITASWPIFMFYTFYLLWPEDAGIEPRTVAEFPLTVRYANQ